MSLLGRVDPGLPSAVDLLARIDSTIACLTWTDIEAAILEAREGVDSGGAPVDNSIRRVADALLSAIRWHGHQPDIAPATTSALPMGVAPICMYCARYHRDDGRMGFRCDAFPEGIPEAIIANREDHRRPVKGDHGLQWEQEPELPRIDHDFYDRML